MSARDLVWGGHASRRLVAAVLAVHVAALIWLCGDIDRLRLIAYDVHEMSSEAAVNDPPAALVPLGYSEDDPRDLHVFGAIAEPIVAGIGSDAEKLRRLGDYILSLRREGAPDVGDPRLSVAWAGLQRGEHGSYRFGPLDGGAWLFDRLPAPLDRAIDNVTATGIAGWS